MYGEIAPRESFEETLDFLARAGAREGLDPPQQRNFVVRMETVAVQRAAEIVRRGHEQLPQHFRLPRRQGFRIDRVNVGVSEQAQPLKAFLVGDRLGESRYGGWIENIAALDRGGHVEM